MVGQAALNRSIGVRLPVSQPAGTAPGADWHSLLGGFSFQGSDSPHPVVTASTQHHPASALHPRPSDRIDVRATGSCAMHVARLAFPSLTEEAATGITFPSRFSSAIQTSIARPSTP
jgi:hypothetical protein